MIQEPVVYSILRMSTNTRQQCYYQQDVPDPQACIYPVLPSPSGGQRSGRLALAFVIMTL